MIIMICSHHSKVAQYYWRLKYNWSISNRVITDNHRESIPILFLFRLHQFRLTGVLPVIRWRRRRAFFPSSSRRHVQSHVHRQLRRHSRRVGMSRARLDGGRKPHRHGAGTAVPPQLDHRPLRLDRWRHRGPAPPLPPPRLLSQAKAKERENASGKKSSASHHEECERRRGRDRWD